jgi:hypothetical protein
VESAGGRRGAFVLYVGDKKYDERCISPNVELNAFISRHLAK